MNIEDLLAHWKINGNYKQLAGYEDTNYYIKSENNEYLLKISDGALDAVLKMQIDAMMHLGIQTKIYSNENHTARLIPWQPGIPWARHEPKTPNLLHDLGVKAADHYVRLSSFQHPASERKNFHWDLAQALWIEEKIELLEGKLKSQVKQFFGKYIDLKKKYQNLPKTMIHNDLNDFNILVENHEVSGFIDYGDMCYSQRINEVAILLTYAMMDFNAPLDAAHHVLKGFTSICPLEVEEIDCLFTLIGMRLAVSLVSSQQAMEQNPSNEYLQISRRPAIVLLDKLAKTNERLATYRFRAASGLEIIDSTEFKEWITKNEVAQVCNFKREHAYLLDLGVGSLELGHESYYNDAFQHERDIQRILETKRKSIAIGAYDEIRPLYSSDDFTQIGNEGQRWRTVHIGLDFFDKAGSKVYAFSDGVVHALKYNEGDKNYGNTVILKHDCFFTLYGHLSSETLTHIKVGQSVRAGQHIAWFGEPHENGNWAPHLHFQIMLDMLDYVDDFPGVCYVEERNVWTALCPDPSSFLNLEVIEKSKPEAEEILRKRREKLGRSYSLSYNEPLHIVRAHGTYLYNDKGRKFLDCVNNVAHVGHQNIRVTEAAARQNQLLNTNTRYLHQNIVELAEKLTSTLPEQLKVCHFVNSGSEANELALRMARTVTGRNGIVAMEHGYHGNTSLCVDISSYKFDGKGGAGKKDFIQIVPMPDPVRPSDFKTFNLDPEKPIPAAFIHESILSCGGQVVMPEGFFSALYDKFRESGMVLIADEVQTGLGRVGSHMWAFEAEGVQPDIVTIGKPFGNGHPLAAVVCTEAIADAFHNGMEYFNTFGGNPVSCAVGLEVLNVIQDDGLQEHAFHLGQWIKAELENLSKKYPFIADVRGRGLFLGWEFADPETRQPLPEKAGFFVNEMKRHGILLSTDGPLYNVIKFKPPMVFSKEQADYMLEWTDNVLQY